MLIKGNLGGEGSRGVVGVKPAKPQEAMNPKARPEAHELLNSKAPKPQIRRLLLRPEAHEEEGGFYPNA